MARQVFTKDDLDLAQRADQLLPLTRSQRAISRLEQQVLGHVDVDGEAHVRDAELCLLDRLLELDVVQLPQHGLALVGRSATELALLLAGEQSEGTRVLLCLAAGFIELLLGAITTARAVRHVNQHGMLLPDRWASSPRHRPIGYQMGSLKHNRVASVTPSGTLPFLRCDIAAFLRDTETSY